MSKKYVVGCWFEFWRQNVVKMDGCWLWIGPLDRDGYGKTSIFGKSEAVHRLSLEASRGSVAPGLVVDHLCRVKNCVNPYISRLTIFKGERGGAAHK